MQSKQQETMNLNFLSEYQQYFHPRVLLSHSEKGKSKGHRADKSKSAQPTKQTQKIYRESGIFDIEDSGLSVYFVISIINYF